MLAFVASSLTAFARSSMEILLGGGMHHLLRLLRSSLIVWLMIEVTGHDANLLAMLTLRLNQIVTAANRPEVTT